MNNTNTNETLALIEKHPLTIALRAEEAAALLKERETAAALVVELMLEADTVLPGLQARIDELKEALSLHDAKRLVLQNKMSVTAAELYSEKLRISSAIANAQMALENTCDTRIDEAIHFFQDMRENLLCKKIDYDQRTGGINLRSMSRELITWSNRPSIRNALAYCLEAIKELEKMKLYAVLDVQRIEALKAAIPDPDEFHEFLGDKPLPKVNTDERSLFKSDDQLSWEIGKVLEKAKKMIGR